MTKYKCPDCWAGYADNASAGSVKAIVAKVTVPPVSCTSTTTSSKFLVGLDGFTSKDFAYSEVYAVCAAGSVFYGAGWYDSITGEAGSTPWTPAAGETVSLSVSESKGNFTFRLTDITKNMTTSGSSKATGAGLTSAECVTDLATGFPLANFTRIQFSGCDATIGGVKKGIGAFGSSATLDKFICYNENETTVLAVPSTLKSPTTLNRFTVTFKATGP